MSSSSRPCLDSNYPAHTLCAMIKPLEELLHEANQSIGHLMNLVAANDQGAGLRAFRLEFPFLDPAMPKPEVNADVCGRFEHCPKVMSTIRDYVERYCKHFCDSDGACEGGTPYRPCHTLPPAGAWLCPQHQAQPIQCFFGWVTPTENQAAMRRACQQASDKFTAICTHHRVSLRTLLTCVQLACTAVVNEFGTVITFCR